MGRPGHLVPGTGPTPIVHAPVSHNGRPEPGPGPSPGGERQGGGCTTAQLRRFIKSRAYIPLHEIRRRFLISTEDDDVAGIQLATGRIYVGLPEREAQMLGELLRGGEVGYELQLDPVSPIVVGVYPMRPVDAELTRSERRLRDTRGVARSAGLSPSTQRKMTSLIWNEPDTGYR